MILFCGFFFIIDRWLKWQALHGWAADRLLNRWFGWHPFLNPGVAFGIPVPAWLIILLTIPIILLLGYLVTMSFAERGAHNVEPVQLERYALCATRYALIFAGALSNLIDRVLYGHTVDYILIFTGVINLADVMIVFGFVIYFFCSRKSIKS